ncbi:protein of unknown function (plasmid) [Cupriavidus taiwanensis]|uniref:Uncharacterized protein n=1 Tax=Cupriavidus taiwanensis TaxID=164546 RepID=A0A375IT31_9BURK|nr:hypothetical protein CT19425_U610033 [Cupriavidus taiwanensis]SPK77747.1 protein of unknown function [Cupriavidus taiwanensis]
MTASDAHVCSLLHVPGPAVAACSENAPSIVARVTNPVAKYRQRFLSIVSPFFDFFESQQCPDPRGLQQAGSHFKDNCLIYDRLSLRL